MSDFTTTTVQIPCCVCGIKIDPNPTNMCNACMQKNFNIADKIPQTSSIIYCRGCGRYQISPTKWAAYALESPELLSLCLKHIPNLKDFKIIDSKFLYTEPHSRRIKITLTLEYETPEKVVLRQSLVITFVITLQQCPQCCEAATPRAHWNSNVQLRQSGVNKRTLFWLEQQILSCKAHMSATDIIRTDNGLDFHFTDKSSASKFVNFCTSKIPAFTNQSSKLLSENFQCATADQRHSFLVRAPPFSRQDLVILPKELVKANGNKTQVCIVLRICKIIKLVDPQSGLIVDVEGSTFWKKPFEPILTARDLRRFVVLSIDEVERKGRMVIADVEITDEETFDERIFVRTYLGAKIVEGCTVLGYDRRVSALPDAAEDILKKRDLPQVIIVGRAPESKSKIKVKELVPHNESDDDNFGNFLDDLAEDPEMRQDIHIYGENDEEVTLANE